jgi:TonB family protein
VEFIWIPDSQSSADEAGFEARTFKVGQGVKAPVAIFQPEAEYTDDARSAGISGVCVVALTVDAHGLPQNVRIVRKLDQGLDQNAVNTVSRYRFKPAMSEEGPIPVSLQIEVSYRLR